MHEDVGGSEVVPVKSHPFALVCPAFVLHGYIRVNHLAQEAHDNQDGVYGYGAENLPGRFLNNPDTLVKMFGLSSNWQIFSVRRVVGVRHITINGTPGSRELTIPIPTESHACSHEVQVQPRMGATKGTCRCQWVVVVAVVASQQPCRHVSGGCSHCHSELVWARTCGRVRVLLLNRGR